MSKDIKCHPKVFDLLSHKSVLKQKIFREGKKYFSTLKELANDMASCYDEQVCKVDDSVKIEFKDKGTFECELHFGGDILLFTMHTNVFTFERNHIIWKNGYVKEDKNRAYFCMINIYNFLADSLRYNRMDDQGVLLGRIFINHEGHFFVEGRKQLGFLFNHIGQQTINQDTLREILNTAMIYSLEYDLTVPPYKSVRTVSVGQVLALSEELHHKTAKKVELGYYSRMQKD